MRTLAKNINNDIYITGNGLAFAEGGTCRATVIESLVSTQKGELQFDKEYGIDYFGTVFVNKMYMGVCAADIRSKVKALPWVKSIKNFSFSYDPKESAFVWSMTVISAEDEEVNVSSFKKEGPATIGIRWTDVEGIPDGLDKVVERLDRITNVHLPKVDGKSNLAAVKTSLNTVIDSIKSAN